MKIIRIFKTPDENNGNIKELMSTQQKQDESFVQYMSRDQHNVAKAFPKIAGANRQNFAVSMFCQALPGQEVARMTAVQAKGDVASAHYCVAD